MTIRSLALKSGETSAEDHRIILGALLGGADDGLDRRGGLFHHRGTADLSGTGMTATVAPFVAAVSGGEVTHQGTYLVASTEDIEVQLEDGSADQDRVDILGVVVSHDEYDGSGDTEAEVRVIDPESDVSYLPLFEITVPQGATAGQGGIDWPEEAGDALPDGIEDLREYTSSAGGVVTVPNADARDRMEDPVDGTLVYVTADRNLFIREGEEWVSVAGPRHEERRPKILSGLVTHFSANEDPTSGYRRGSARVDFPEGAFDETPAIFLTGVSNVPGVLVELSSIHRDNEGFTIRCARTNLAEFTVSWMAVERTEETIRAVRPDPQPDAAAQDDTD